MRPNQTIRECQKCLELSKTTKTVKGYGPLCRRCRQELFEERRAK